MYYLLPDNFSLLCKLKKYCQAGMLSHPDYAETMTMTMTRLCWCCFDSITGLSFLRYSRWLSECEENNPKAGLSIKLVWLFHWDYHFMDCWCWKDSAVSIVLLNQYTWFGVKYLSYNQLCLWLYKERVQSIIKWHYSL